MTQERLPEYLKQGEAARLFPVLSTTSKEGRTASIFLACLCRIDEFGASLLKSLGQRVGKRAILSAYTEVVLSKQVGGINERPDGLIHLQVGSRNWRALVEAKVGNNDLNADQLERYRNIAKENGIDCVISISNQFATSPDSHPIESVRKSRSKLPVFHWSWMHILTTADLLISGKDIADVDQLLLLNELRRFLSHESAGVKGFDRMPKQWTELNKLISSGGVVPSRSEIAQIVVEAWHQETRDLSLILSRMTGMTVAEKLPNKHKGTPAERVKDEQTILKDRCHLESTLLVPDAAAPLEIKADLARRSIDVGMTLKAPDDKKSTKARLNWLLKQVKSKDLDNLYVRLMWPGGSEDTQYSVAELREDPDICSTGKDHLVAHSFQLFESTRLGAKFTQQTNFISELEHLVPKFYGEIGSNLNAWVKRAPRIQSERQNEQDVSTSGLAEDAEDFQP